MGCGSENYGYFVAANVDPVALDGSGEVNDLDYILRVSDLKSTETRLVVLLPNNRGITLQSHSNHAAVPQQSVPHTKMGIGSQRVR